MAGADQAAQFVEGGIIRACHAPILRQSPGGHKFGKRGHFPP
jgi:hypothetical protein